MAIGSAVVIAGAAWWWVADSGNARQVTVGQTSTTAATPATSTSTPTTVPTPVDVTAMWPPPGSSGRFASATDVARSFAVDFLHFRVPVVGEFRQGDSRSGEVRITPRVRGPATTVLVRQIGAAGDWYVLGATTADIAVDLPGALSEISSPVRVTGRALAFEGTVQVEVREDGQAGAIGAGVVTGGGDIPRPFAGSIAFETPSAPYGALVFFTASAENGEVWQAAAFRVALVSTDAQAAACGGYRPQHLQPGPGQMEVTVFFSCDASGSVEGTVVAAHRLAASSPRILEASLITLLAGPTSAEHQAGVGSLFSADTASVLRSVTIANGHAVVDFDDLAAVIPNASASAGSQRLLAELDATVFQFRTVRSVEYRLAGSCTEFNDWLQIGGCEPRTRLASKD